jgi:hydrogenase small subunit
MNENQPTVYDEIRAKGHSRRDFLKFCGMIGAFLGLEHSGVAQIVKALETNPRLPVVWFHFQECTCCSESFIRSSHPIVADIVLDKISLDYTQTLMAPAGFQAEKSLKDTMEKYKGKYLMLVEGSIPTDEGGAYCCIAGRSAVEIVKEAAEGAMAIIAWGNCASSGCVQSASPNPTGAKPVHKIISKPVINVQGCPPIAEVMAGIVVHLLTFKAPPELDSLGRPKAFFSRRVHDTCYRRPNYDAGLFVQAWDDENARKGYCLYKMGCKGPNTYNSCGVIKWNNGVSFPIQSGHPCIGCSEANFWDNSPFYHHLPEFPGFGIESNADKIGLGLGVVTAVGITAHAITTNFRKNKLINKGFEETENENSKS